MFAGVDNNRNQDDNGVRSIWHNFPAGFTCLFLTNAVFFIVGFIVPLFNYLPNFIYYTINNVQLWRLFTSFLFVGTGINGIISIFITYYMLYTILVPIQRKLSTAYLICQVFFQIVFLNLLFALVGEIIVLIGLVYHDFLITFGLMPLILILIWERIAENPEALTTFCFFPCLIKAKFIPWLFVLLLMLMGGNVLATLLAAVLGYVQFMLLRRKILKSPIGLYFAIDRILPKIITGRHDYIRASDVEQNLKIECGNCWQSAAHNSEAQPRNPFVNSNVRTVQKPATTFKQMSGKGVRIGGDPQPPQNNNINVISANDDGDNHILPNRLATNQSTTSQTGFASPAHF